MSIAEARERGAAYPLIGANVGSTCHGTVLSFKVSSLTGFHVPGAGIFTTCGQFDPASWYPSSLLHVGLQPSSPGPSARALITGSSGRTAPAAGSLLRIMPLPWSCSLNDACAVIVHGTRTTDRKS